MFLHGIEDFRNIRGDTCVYLPLPIDELKTFDCVIANPPFSLKEWSRKLGK
jgi:type I restriction enzyme M protein